MDSQIAEVDAADAARIAATLAKDLAALDRLFDDGLIYTHSNSMVDTKASYLDGLRNGKLNYRALSVDNVTTRLHGDVAIRTGHMAADVVVMQLRSSFTSVWKRTSDGWRMIAWQSTPLPAPK